MDGAEHYSVLQRNEAEELWVRLDYCMDCWDAALDTLEPETLHSLWRTRFVDRNAARQTPVNEYTPLLEICYDSLGADEIDSQAMAYLSAMVLRRQKVFRLVRTERDADTDQEALLFYDTVSQAEVRVPDPPLTLDELRATRRVLQERLAAVTPDDGPATQEVVHEPD